MQLIEIVPGEKFDYMLEPDVNFFRLVDVRTQVGLSEDIQGHENAEMVQKEFEKVSQAWDVITNAMRHVDTVNREKQAILMASAISRGGHLTTEANIINNFKAGLEKYAKFCRDFCRTDARIIGALEYIEAGKDKYIPFI